MIVCICNSVTERRLRAAISEGADSFDALQFELGVALCCGKCEPMAREILADELGHDDDKADKASCCSLTFPPKPYATLFFQPRRSI